MIIKIYGERNTGTNYLLQLLRTHLNLLAEFKWGAAVLSAFPPVNIDRLKELGWKHRLVSKDFLQNENFSRETVLILTLTKNPYSWLLSLHQRPYAAIQMRTKVKQGSRIQGDLFPRSRLEWYFIRFMRCFGRYGELFLSRYPRWCEYERLSFNDFIRARWFSRFDEGKDDGYENAIKLWNEKNKAYLELAKHYNVLLLTYEELLASPEIVVKKIMDYTGYKLKNFENLLEAAKEEDKVKGKNNQYYRDYYLKEQWREKLNQKEIKWISSQLDPLVMQSFGYQLL